MQPKTDGDNPTLERAYKKMKIISTVASTIKTVLLSYKGKWKDFYESISGNMPSYHTRRSRKDCTEGKYAENPTRHHSKWQNN